MDKLYIGNAFSLNMLPSEACDVQVTPVANPVGFLADWSEVGITPTSVVGHEDTAAVFSDQLGLTVPTNRVSLTLTPGDVLLVGQYIGPRLSEGAKTLPEGASIQWKTVTFKLV